MNILVLNCGSATLKHQLIACGTDGSQQVLARGAEHIGGDAPGSAPSPGPRPAADYARAARTVFERLPHRADAIGHRVVHGGALFTAPTRVDGEVLRRLGTLRTLAPLHNPPSLAVIDAALQRYESAVPMVAVFDTAFHATIPPEAATYAIPHDLAARHNIKRYGFHGLAHQYMTARYAALRGMAVDQVRAVSLQLGAGCSAAAIKDGRSVDTSMGFTPLEGLVMGTRSGDLDPAIVPFLAQAEGVSAGEVERWLNERSGLLGVSQLSGDVRVLLAAADGGDAPLAALALAVFTYRVRKYIGAYLAALGGAQAVLFGGGIGEGSPGVRAAICAGMEPLGLGLDSQRNGQLVQQEGLISRDGSPVEIYVIAVDEEALIAREVFTCLQAPRAAGRPSASS